MTPEEKRAEKARNLRYKRPALQSMGYEFMIEELTEIVEACSDVTYAYGDNYELMASMIGDEDDADEFRMLFPALSSDAEVLQDRLAEARDAWDKFGLEYDDCTVALVGNRYEVVGYDDYETDYYSLTDYTRELAITEAGKRLMRLTKADMLDTIGRSVGVMMAFFDLRQRYDYLEASLDVLRGENAARLNTAKEINALYEKANAADFNPMSPDTRKFDELLRRLPQRVFVE